MEDHYDKISFGGLTALLKRVQARKRLKQMVGGGRKLGKRGMRSLGKGKRALMRSGKRGVAGSRRVIKRNPLLAAGAAGGLGAGAGYAGRRER